MKNTDPFRYENTASHLFCLTLSDALPLLYCSEMQRIKQIDIGMENAFFFVKQNVTSHFSAICFVTWQRSIVCGAAS